MEMQFEKNEELAMYTFGVSFLAAILFGLIINLGGLKNIYGVFLLFALIIFVFYSDSVVKKTLME